MANQRIGVVFDFGNVLYAVDYPAMARRLAGGRAEAFLERFVGSSLQVAYESGRMGLTEVLAGFAEEGFRCDRERFLEAYLSLFSPVEGMRALVEGLAGRVPLGLLSNTSPEHAHLFIECVPEFPYFSARAYSFEVGRMKPAPELYHEISARLGLAPNRLVYIDDIEENVEGARAVGMEGIGFHGVAPLCRRLAELGVDLSGVCVA